MGPPQVRQFNNTIPVRACSIPVSTLGLTEICGLQTFVPQCRSFAWYLPSSAVNTSPFSLIIYSSGELPIVEPLKLRGDETKKTAEVLMDFPARQSRFCFLLTFSPTSRC